MAVLSFLTLYFNHLSLPEKIHVIVNLAMLLSLFFFLSTRHFFSCLLGRVSPYKDDHQNPTTAVRRQSGDHQLTEVGKLFYVSVACCFYVLLLQVIVLGFQVVTLLMRKEDGDVSFREYSLLYLPFVQTLAWIVLLLSTFYCKFNVLDKFPFFIRLWWISAFFLCIYIAYADTKLLLDNLITLSSHVIVNFISFPSLAFLCFVSIRGVTGIQLHHNSNLDLQEPLLSDGEEEGSTACIKVTPYENAGIKSLLTLSWLNPILSIGSKRPLELNDIPLLATKDRSKTCYKILNLNLDKLKIENPSKPPSLAIALWRSFWKEAAVNAVFAGLDTLVSYVGPFLISYFVDYLSGNITFEHEGYILASIFFAAKLVETVTTRQWYLGVDILGMHVRSSLTAMVYRKGLRLSSTARGCHTTGEIVNYMAVDVQRIGDYSWYLHDIWMLPMQIILALAILYKNVGLASIATLIATVISIVITIPLAKIQEEYQDKLMAAKDERMRKTSECLKNMRILKLQAWEDRYRLELEEMRNVEFKWLRKALYSQAFITFFFWASPIFVAVITFATRILMGGQLTAGSVLSALATFRILQEPLRNFPDLISMIAQTTVSLDRVSGFLQQDELPRDATIRVPQDMTDMAVEIKDGNFCWDPASPNLTLSNIQLKVTKGMHVAVCGVVGSGKSSFLSCILGEIPKISGEVSGKCSFTHFI